MNGIHDMGGMTDFGPILREMDEPTFHADWERRVLGMVRNTVDPLFNWDEFRFALERIEPVEYLTSSYYERWLTALERFLVEKGLIDAVELGARSAGEAPHAGLPLPPAETQEESIAPMLRPSENGEPRFKPGDAVAVHSLHPPGHTRMPRYVRGKRGAVDRYLGAFVLPDAQALGLGRYPQPVYAVRFSAQELWGTAANEKDSVCVDLWEGYLTNAA